MKNEVIVDGVRLTREQLQEILPMVSSEHFVVLSDGTCPKFTAVVETALALYDDLERGKGGPDE